MRSTRGPSEVPKSRRENHFSLGWVHSQSYWIRVTGISSAIESMPFRHRRSPPRSANSLVWWDFVVGKSDDEGGLEPAPVLVLAFYDEVSGASFEGMPRTAAVEPYVQDVLALKTRGPNDVVGQKVAAVDTQSDLIIS